MMVSAWTHSFFNFVCSSSSASGTIEGGGEAMTLEIVKLKATFSKSR